MARGNEAVGALLDEYADLLAIAGGDEAFKARVYEKAARAIAGHAQDVARLDPDELKRIPGVGTSIADKIEEFLRTGTIGAVERLRAKIPPGVRTLTTVPGLGPRKAMILYERVGVDSLDSLERAIGEGRLKGLRGFGPKTAQNILDGIQRARGGGGRAQLDVGLELAEEIVAELTARPEVARCDYAGSVRRFQETVGDVDILAASDEPRLVMDAFAALPLVERVLVHGETKTSVLTRGGLQVDLRVVPLAAWGAAMIYFTGSKAHNVRVREYAQRQGLTLSEYGLSTVEDDRLVAAQTEEEVYASLGMEWVPPPLRENRGEIELAQAAALPTVVTIDDVQGDLHTHTNLTDGVSTLAEMVAAAQARGLRYLAITDHAKNLPMQRMTDAKMLRQRSAVAQLAAQVPIALLHGTELNIDPDGGVDWDADFLAGFDLCVASIHSHFSQSPKALTQRLIRACENPYVSIIGHPTTRQLNRRPPIEPDWDAVFACAAATGTAMEINAYPDRLDLPDELLIRAKEQGVVFALDTDSHSTVHFDYLRYGVGTAQRAWLTPDDIITCWPLERVRAFITAKRP